MTESILMLVLMLAIFYFMLIRPENKRKKANEEMRNNLKKGDTVTTIGGIVGTIVHIKEENIVPTVEDVDNAVNEFLSSIKDEAQRKEFKVTDELKRYFENRVKVEKAVALIVDNAVRK